MLASGVRNLTVTIRGLTITAPSCYKVRSLKSNLFDEVLELSMSTDVATCSVVISSHRARKIRASLNVVGKVKAARRKREMMKFMSGYAEMSANRGIGTVEEHAKEAIGKSYKYSITKSLYQDEWDPSGKEIRHSLDMAVRQGINVVRIGGVFDEAGRVGKRGEKVFAIMCHKLGSLDAAKAAWPCQPKGLSPEAFNPVDPSDAEAYDAMFPDHPLSLARGFVRCVVDGFCEPRGDEPTPGPLAKVRENVKSGG